MRLFIRGAWRSFGASEHREYGRNADVQVTRSVGQEQVTTSSSWALLKDNPSTSSTCLGHISTQSLTSLKAFYGAFGDGRGTDAADHECIWLDSSHYITFTSDGRTCQPENMKRQSQVMTLRLASIERLASFYTRMKAKEIAPVQALVDGSSVAILYEDPDGNILKISGSAMSGLKISNSMVGPPALQGSVKVDPEAFFEAVLPRRWKEEELDVQSLTMRVKTEQIVAE